MASGSAGGSKGTKKAGTGKSSKAKGRVPKIDMNRFSKENMGTPF